VNKAALWVVTSFYNPAGYQRRIQNFFAFRRHLNAQLLVVELAEPGRHQLDSGDADKVVKVTGDDLIWQKERLLNIAISALPKEAKYVAWVDCDVIFDKPGWVVEAQSILENGADFVQLFETAKHLPPEVQPTDISPGKCRTEQPIVFEQSFAAAVASGNYFSPEKRQTRVEAESGIGGTGSPPVAHGMAWAGTRRLLEDIGLYDACIVGGGDLAMSLGIIGCAHKLEMRRPMTDEHTRHYLSWAQKLNGSASVKLGFLPGTIYHCWHGRFARRNYRSRHETLKHLGFNPYDHLLKSENGTWNWAHHAGDLKKAVSSYFFERQEDQIEA
jgi:hypothetical protein